jgi:Phosphotransferase enzyme family
MTRLTCVTESSLPTYIVDFLKNEFGPEIAEQMKVEEEKSAQQQVWILLFKHPGAVEWWKDALAVGNQRLVVRHWKGASRWWNLNNNATSGVKVMAMAELAGYRVAHRALPSIQIPELLYASFDDESPWAIFTYVGHMSSYFTETKLPDTSWFDGMVKVRHEFGFEEAHPRWGRVPLDNVLEYATDVLMTVTIPLHRYINEQQEGLDWSSLGKDGEGITYQDMAFFYMTAHDRMMENPQGDEKVTNLTRVLGQCIERLQLESASVHRLAPVLCHMDCQPQNLIFFKEGGSPKILSVLDWEEAAYADPRFELIMLARKVCANREQAEAIWALYQDELNLDLGDIESWLKLETVHSLTTLVLQSMNLLGGGRNPWEAKPDLDEKMKREFFRLVGLGWDFCREVAIIPQAVDQ